MDFETLLARLLRMHCSVDFSIQGGVDRQVNAALKLSDGSEVKGTAPVPPFRYGDTIVYAQTQALVAAVAEAHDKGFLNDQNFPE